MHSWARFPLTPQLVFALVLLTAACQFISQLTFLWANGPVIRLWSDVDAQHRLQLKDIPYDLLQTVDSVLPRDASVLLVTPGQNVRRHEYLTFHRALYFLTPRPVWWLTAALSDGTWESRWWISTPLTPESIRAVAREKNTSYVLVCGVADFLPLGRQIVADESGSLFQVDENQSSSLAQPAGPVTLSRTWPLQLALAIGVIFILGWLPLAIARRMGGYRMHGIEVVSLAWALGAGLTSVAMLWFYVVGISASGQIAILTTLAGATLLYNRYQIFTSGAWQAKVKFVPSAPLAIHFLQSPVRIFLLLFLGLQIAFVTLLALGRPLEVWDSWVTWSMKARAIFLEGTISPTIYADPSRAVTNLDYPLHLPLLEAWVYGWLGAPDDRLVGIISILFYLALAGLCFSSLRRRGTEPLLALSATVAIVSLTPVALSASWVFADIPLAVYAGITAIYLVQWLEQKTPAALFIAAIAAGLMPWTKREGIVLLIVLCIATLIVRRRTRHAIWAVVVLLFASAVLSGPWWGFVIWHEIPSAAFLSLTPATLLANLTRLPPIGWQMLLQFVSPQWAFVWPLAALFWTLKRRRNSQTTSGDNGRIADGLLLATVLYVGLMSLSYVFSAFVPYQQHIVSSLPRLLIHVAPWPILWLACQSETRE
jgi:hypothetical protein